MKDFFLKVWAKNVAAHYTQNNMGLFSGLAPFNLRFLICKVRKRVRTCWEGVRRQPL